MHAAGRDCWPAMQMVLLPSSPAHTRAHATVHMHPSSCARSCCAGKTTTQRTVAEDAAREALPAQARDAVHHESHALALMRAQLACDEGLDVDGAERAPLLGLLQGGVEEQQRLAGGDVVGGLQRKPGWEGAEACSRYAQMAVPSAWAHVRMVSVQSYPPAPAGPGIPANGSPALRPRPTRLSAACAACSAASRGAPSSGPASRGRACPCSWASGTAATTEGSRPTCGARWVAGGPGGTFNVKDGSGQRKRRRVRGGGAAPQRSRSSMRAWPQRHAGRSHAPCSNLVGRLDSGASRQSPCVRSPAGRQHRPGPAQAQAQRGGAPCRWHQPLLRLALPLVSADRAAWRRRILTVAAGVGVVAAVGVVAVGAIHASYGRLGLLGAEVHDPCRWRGRPLHGCCRPLLLCALPVHSGGACVGFKRMQAAVTGRAACVAPRV